MFPIIEVCSSKSEAVEYLGTKSKFWYRHGDRQMLFKAEERGTGEDWAEKIACELCALLGFPHIGYDMAMDIDEPRRRSEIRPTQGVGLVAHWIGGHKVADPVSNFAFPLRRVVV